MASRISLVIINILRWNILLLYVDEEVTGGEVEVTAKLGFLTVLRSVYNVCDIVSGGCPIQGMYS